MCAVSVPNGASLELDFDFVPMMGCARRLVLQLHAHFVSGLLLVCLLVVASASSVVVSSSSLYLHPRSAGLLLDQKGFM